MWSGRLDELCDRCGLRHWQSFNARNGETLSTRCRQAENRAREPVPDDLEKPCTVCAALHSVNLSCSENMNRTINRATLARQDQDLIERWGPVVAEAAARDPYYRRLDSTLDSL